MNPLAHEDFPPNAIESLMRLAALYGRVGASRIYRVPQLAAVGAGVDSQSVSVPFRRSGLVLAAYGTTLGATAAEAANLEVRIQMGGTEDLITDGESFAFASFRALFGDSQNWFPIGKRVRLKADWSVTFRNRSGAGITPSMYFVVLED